MDAIHHSVTAYQAIRNRILALQTDVDDVTLADTVEGLTDLHEVVAAIVRSAVVDEAMADGLKGHIGQLQERLERIYERARRRRQIARDAMFEVDLKKITAPDFTISIRPGLPALVVTDEKAIPTAYWQEREPKLDRQGLLSDLKHGASVPGVELSNPEPILSVRVK